MAQSTLFIVGAGGHGKVVADCAAVQRRWLEIRLLDERWPDLSAVSDWPVVGRFADALRLDGTNYEAIVALGNAETRLDWHSRISAAGVRLATVVHPASVVSTRADIGRGSVVVAGAIVNIGARVGEACIVNTAASIDHDCELADGVHVSPGARLAGNVSVGRGSWIGIGSTVRQGVKIGRSCIVGAGAVVVSDVPDCTTVVGVPARPIAAKTSGIQ